MNKTEERVYSQAEVNSLKETIQVLKDTIVDQVLEIKYLNRNINEMNSTINAYQQALAEAREAAVPTKDLDGKNSKSGAAEKN